MSDPLKVIGAKTTESSTGGRLADVETGGALGGSANHLRNKLQPDNKVDNSNKVITLTNAFLPNSAPSIDVRI